MDSGNSGSISASSDEEYDSSSHADPSFLNHFGSISHPQQPPLVPSHPTSIFDLSSSYLHALSQPHPSPHSSFLNLDSHQGQRSEPNCTLPESLPSSSSAATPNQCLSGHDNINNNARQQHLSSLQTNNLVRNSKKRSRASRRAPTTVLTTDTTNFRSMVQEFTGIPAPPFSSPSFSRRLPLRPNPLLSTTSSRTLLHNNTINVSPNNNSLNYQLLPDLSLPYQPPPQNLMQNIHSIPSFHPSSSSLHTLVPAGFGAKSLSMPTLDAHLVGHEHVHVVSEGMFLRSDHSDGGGRRDPFRCLDGNNYGGGCKLNMSVSASSSLNHEKNLENGNGNSPREGGAVEAWICSSDQ